MKLAKDQKGFAVFEIILAVVVVLVVGVVWLKSSSTYAKNVPASTTTTKVATTTKLTSSANPMFYGWAVTYTATVTNTAHANIVGGVVGFSIKSNTGALVNFNCIGYVHTVGLSRTAPQTAKCALPANTFTPTGSPYIVTANFASDGKFTDSSASLSQVVSKVFPK
jgi:hypothetical protein